jgi:alanine racemase
MNRGDSYSCWVEVDLKAVEGNVRLLQEHTGVQVMAVVKANGYGHGAVPVAKAAVRGGATWLGVARPEEAFELRYAGIDTPMLALGFTPAERLDECILDDISLTLWNSEQLSTVAQAAMRAGSDARVHLKVDTGMNRLGVQPSLALELAGRIAQTSGVLLEGIFTHFARADEKDRATSDEQENRFRQVLDELDQAGIKPRVIHAANSAAGLRRSSAYFNLVRAGISIYGLHPSAECALPSNFSPALSWKTVLSHVKTVPAGQGISYGHIYTTQRDERIGTLPVGYADGYRRVQGNNVLVGGKKVPVVGRVCMDQVMVNLDTVSEAKDGDEVVLIGKQGDACISAEHVASVWGTINYEVVCGIGPRVPRFYRGS